MPINSNAQTKVDVDDGGKQRKTQSKNGLLVDGHPEIGDTVYSQSGGILGTVEFFYDQRSATEYRVKVTSQAEDPMLVEVVDAQNRAGDNIGKMLLAHPGQAKNIPSTHGGVSVKIS